MKINLKEIDYTLFTITSHVINTTHEIYNINYKNEELEFQTCKLVIDSIDHSTGEIILRFPLKKSNVFYSKIIELEENYTTIVNKKSKSDLILSSLLNKNFLKLKVLFRNGSPLIKIYNSSNELVNYYNLKIEDSIICIVSSKYIYKSNSNIYYNLLIKEILLF